MRNELRETVRGLEPVLVDVEDHVRRRQSADSLELDVLGSRMTIEPLVLRALIDARGRQDWVKVGGIIDRLEAGLPRAPGGSKRSRSQDPG